MREAHKVGVEKNAEKLSRRYTRDEGRVLRYSFDLDKGYEL